MPNNKHTDPFTQNKTDRDSTLSMFKNSGAKGFLDSLEGLDSTPPPGLTPKPKASSPSEQNQNDASRNSILSMVKESGAQGLFDLPSGSELDSTNSQKSAPPPGLGGKNFSSQINHFAEPVAPEIKTQNKRKTFKTIEYASAPQEGRKELNSIENTINRIIFPRDVSDNKIFYRKAKKGKPTYIIFPGKDDVVHYKNEDDANFNSSSRGKRSILDRTIEAVTSYIKGDPESTLSEIGNSEYLSDKGYGFIICSYDYGEPANEADIYNTADKVKELLDKEGIKPEDTNIIGLSIGTTAATYLASQAKSDKPYASATLIDPPTSMNGAARNINNKILSKFNTLGKEGKLLDNIHNIRNIPKGTKINVVDHRNDWVVPTGQHKECYHEAKKIDPSAILIEAEQGHLSSASPVKATMMAEICNTKAREKDFNKTDFFQLHDRARTIRRDTINGYSLRDHYLKEYACKNKNLPKGTAERYTVANRTVGDKGKRQIDELAKNYGLEPNQDNFILLFGSILSAPTDIATQQREKIVDQIHTLLARLEEIASDQNNGVDIKINPTARQRAGSKSEVRSHNQSNIQKRTPPVRVSQNQNLRISSSKKLQANDFDNLFKTLNSGKDTAYNASNYDWFSNDRINVSYSRSITRSNINLPPRIIQKPRNEKIQITEENKSLFSSIWQKKGSATLTESQIAKKEAETIIQDIESLVNSLEKYNTLIKNNKNIHSEKFDQIDIGQNLTKEEQDRAIKEARRDIKKCEKEIAKIEKEHKSASKHADKLFFQENDKKHNPVEKLKKPHEKQEVKRNPKKSYITSKTLRQKRKFCTKICKQKK